MKIFTWPVVAGAALGIVAPLLTYNGNPGNMGKSVWSDVNRLSSFSYFAVDLLFLAFI